MVTNNNINKPEVSIVIPTHNRADSVGRAIKSVLSQTFQDFEIIVVDDCSADNTEEVVKNFNDERIRYLRHQINKGGAAARNTGIKAAKGAYVGLLDDDDEWLPDKLKKQLDIFNIASDRVGFVTCGLEYVLEKTKEKFFEKKPCIRRNVYKKLLKRAILLGSTPLIKRICFEKAGYFDESLPASQDWDLSIRISKYYEFDYVPEILARYYFHGNQITNSLENVIKARTIILDKYIEDLKKSPAAYAEHLNRLGMLHCIAGDRKAGGKYFSKSIKVYPLQKLAYKYFVPLIFAPKVLERMIKKHVERNTQNGVRRYW